MAWLILGLAIFLGLHSVRIVADPWRTRTVQRLGEGPWKGTFALLSLLGFAVLVWGFGQARLTPVLVWQPPVGMRHASALLTLMAFVFLAAAYVPGNAIKARLRHPMVLGVKVWALAHLLANGRLADLVLFGAFLVWAVLDFRSLRQRDRASPSAAAPSTAMGTALTVVVGLVAWAAFAFWGHRQLIGVAPLGM